MNGADGVYARILDDLTRIWGQMAVYMLRKRVRDVGADEASLSAEDLVRVVELLRERTLPAVLGAEGAAAKARVYLEWIEEADGMPRRADGAKVPP